MYKNDKFVRSTLFNSHVRNTGKKGILIYDAIKWAKLHVYTYNKAKSNCISFMYSNMQIINRLLSAIFTL